MSLVSASVEFQVKLILNGWSTALLIGVISSGILGGELRDLSSTNSVSYTHLDVYKRQQWDDD